GRDDLAPQLPGAGPHHLQERRTLDARGDRDDLPAHARDGRREPGAAAAAVVAGVWTCEHCGETVDEDDVEVCWRCGAPRGQVDTEPSAEPVVGERDDDERIAVFLAFGRGVQTVVAHPIILVAAVPLLVWPLVAIMLGIVPADSFVHPTSLGWREHLA